MYHYIYVYNQLFMCELLENILPEFVQQSIGQFYCHYYVSLFHFCNLNKCLSDKQ